MGDLHAVESYAILCGVTELGLIPDSSTVERLTVNQ